MRQTGETSFHRPLGELLKLLGAQLSLLVRKEVALFRTEAVASVKRETNVVLFFVIAAASGFFALCTIIATIIIALQLIMPLWLAGLSVSVLLVLLSIITAFVGFKQMVKSPFQRTREAIKSDIKMAREGFA